MTRAKLERARKLHAWLDSMASACNARTQANQTHLGCEYCAWLAIYYRAQSLGHDMMGAS